MLCKSSMLTHRLQAVISNLPSTHTSFTLYPPPALLSPPSVPSLLSLLSTLCYLKIAVQQICFEFHITCRVTMQTFPILTVRHTLEPQTALLHRCVEWEIRCVEVFFGDFGEMRELGDAVKERNKKRIPMQKRSHTRGTVVGG